MGKSFWPFLVQSQQDVANVKAIMAKHNARLDVGETLFSAYAVKYRGHYFWLLQHGGGEKLTTAFIEAHVNRDYPDMMLFWPFAGPEGWRDIPESDVYYEECDAILAALPTSSDNVMPHPFHRSAPPAKTPRDEMFEQFQAQGIKLDTAVRIGQLPKSGRCNTCGKQTSIVCSACKSSFTCSSECQKADWYLHRVNCQRLKAYLP